MLVFFVLIIAYVVVTLCSLIYACYKSINAGISKDILQIVMSRHFTTSLAFMVCNSYFIGSNIYFIIYSQKNSNEDFPYIEDPNIIIRIFKLLFAS